MSPSASSSASMPCKTCNGSGERPHWRHDGTMQTCIDCNGRGHFDAPKLVEILTAIQGRKRVRSPLLGKEIKALRSKRPDDARANYVWRMARFHAGIDMSIPMMAAMDVSGDPYVDMLDHIASTYGEALKQPLPWRGM